MKQTDAAQAQQLFSRKDQSSKILGSFELYISKRTAKPDLNCGFSRFRTVVWTRKRSDDLLQIRPGPGLGRGLEPGRALRDNQPLEGCQEDSRVRRAHLWGEIRMLAPPYPPGVNLLSLVLIFSKDQTLQEQIEENEINSFKPSHEIIICLFTVQSKIVSTIE